MKFHLELTDEAVNDLLEAMADRVVARVRPVLARSDFDDVVSVADYMEEHGVGRSAVHGRVKRGELPPIRKVLGTRGWLRSELTSWEKSSRRRRRGGS